jgi:hypothetical protein
MSETLAVADGDLEINAAGSGFLITGRDKMSQDVAESLLNEFDDDTGLGGKLHTMVVPGYGGKTLVVTEVQRILERLQRNQSKDASITPAERITSVVRIDAEQRSETDVAFQAHIQTADNGSLVMTDALKFRPMRLAHTWPHGVNPNN